MPRLTNSQLDVRKLVQGISVVRWKRDLVIASLVVQVFPLFECCRSKQSFMNLVLRWDYKNESPLATFELTRISCENYFSPFVVTSPRTFHFVSFKAQFGKLKSSISVLFKTKTNVLMRILIEKEGNGRKDKGQEKVREQFEVSLFSKKLFSRYFKECWITEAPSTFTFYWR